MRSGDTSVWKCVVELELIVGASIASWLRLFHRLVALTAKKCFLGLGWCFICSFWLCRRVVLLRDAANGAFPTSTVLCQFLLVFCRLGWHWPSVSWIPALEGLRPEGAHYSRVGRGNGWGVLLFFGHFLWRLCLSLHWVTISQKVFQMWTNESHVQECECLFV